MSSTVLSEVLEHSPAAGHQRLVLAIVADSADDYHRASGLPVALIAHRARCDERTVQRALRLLVESGELFLHREAMRVGGESRPAWYRVRRYGEQGKTQIMQSDVAVAARSSSKERPEERGSSDVTRARSTAMRVAVGDLEPRLRERLPHVMERLTALCEARGKPAPDPERVAYRLAKYPDRDHRHAADSLAEWMTEGRGERVALNNVYQRWDDWLRSTEPENELAARRRTRRSNAEDVEQASRELAELQARLEAEGR